MSSEKKFLEEFVKWLDSRTSPDGSKLRIVCELPRDYDDDKFNRPTRTLPVNNKALIERFLKFRKAIIAGPVPFPYLPWGSWFVFYTGERPKKNATKWKKTGERSAVTEGGTVNEGCHREFVIRVPSPMRSNG
jgi:hypothetical protein